MKANYFKYNLSFQLESGEQLKKLEICYHTSGTLSSTSKIVWICHGLTANSNPEQWWPGLVGKNTLYNSDEYFIICANIPGSCYGSTGPLSWNSAKNNFYYSDFPVISIRDIIKSFELLRTHLGIEKIHTLIGASIGGFQVLEWAVTNPVSIEHSIVIASSAKISPWADAFNESQRMAIFSDPSYKKHHPQGGNEGLKAARSIALLSYRNPYTYNHFQQMDEGVHYLNMKASSYQRYQGEKLSKRFNAYSYVSITHTLDSHDLGRDRPGLEFALQQIESKTLIIAIESDLLFNVGEHNFLNEHIKNSTLEMINSDYGHDGFLLEYKKIHHLIIKFYANHSNKQSLQLSSLQTA